MYRVTFLQIDHLTRRPRVLTVTTPLLAAAMTVHDALQLAGVHVRLWRDGAPIVPTVIEEPTS